MSVQKQVEVQIMGQSYRLGCPDGGQQRLLEAVEKVDTAMCKIRDAGKVKARDRIAVLAALNLAFDVSDRNVPSFQASGFAHSEFPATAMGTTRTTRGSRAWSPGSTPRWATMAACCDCPHSSVDFPPVKSNFFARCQRRYFAGNVPRHAMCGLQCNPSAVRAGLYISLNQCSLSAGLEHLLASVIVSRQMNPRPS